jgi:hypothetical protein
MPFIGNQPAKVPLTSADITDSIITSAKITDGTIVNADINSSAAIASSKLSITSPLSIIGNSTAGSEIRLPEDTDNGSNYVALKAPNTLSSDLTFTLPSTDGSANQALITNGSGSLSFATVGAAAGQVIQVVSTSKTDTFSSATTGSFVDITGLSVSITPSATANKILVMYYVSVGGDNAQGNHFTRLVRGSTAIFIGDASTGRTLATCASQPYNVSSTETHFIQFLDSPSTTSSTTYKVQLYNANATGYVNRSSLDSDNTSYPRTVSSITVMEIKG